jgi:hypothetical protein
VSDFAEFGVPLSILPGNHCAAARFVDLVDQKQCHPFVIRERSGRRLLNMWLPLDLVLAAHIMAKVRS